MRARDRLREALDGLRAELGGVRGELDDLRRQLAELRATLGGMQGWLERVDGEQGGQHQWLEATAGRIDDTRDWVGRVAGRTDEAAGAVLGLSERDEQIAEVLAAFERRVADAVALSGDTFALERFDAGLDGEVVGYRGAGCEDAAAVVYRGFEDAFRGSEADIRERQTVYLPLLAGPVLDVGCGRGELLELLAERGIAAEGIDLDAGMVAHCRAKGLDNVTRADAVEHLAHAAPGAFGTIFAAQVVEHLPYETLLAFLRAARAALAPAGRLIMETVNPHAPQALKHFWVDPTHQHPLFPEVVVLLCRLTGFDEAFIWHPQGTGDPDRDRIEQMDYAVVARTARD